jgi:hypothetical protein
VLTFYLALLIGILAQEAANRNIIRDGLPKETTPYSQLTKIIQQFIQLQKDNGILSQEALKSYTTILDHLLPLREEITNPV